MAHDKLSMYCTTIAARNGNTTITYHSTAIVEFDHECIILRDGGYQTVTTKRKMNQAALQFGLPYGVCQRKGLWFVAQRGPKGEWLEGTERPYHDGIKLDRNTGLEFVA